MSYEQNYILIGPMQFPHKKVLWQYIYGFGLVMWWLTHSYTKIHKKLTRQGKLTISKNRIITQNRKSN